MAYYLNLFSPETYEAFSRTNRSISGFRLNSQQLATRVQPGDRFICYLTKLSRWVGVLEVQSKAFVDDTPIYSEDDPFVVRFKVHPLIWLPKEKAVPIRDDSIWNRLSFTRDQDRASSQWTGRIRSSLTSILQEDASVLEEVLSLQAAGGYEFPVDAREYSRMVSHNIRRVDKVIAVSVPDAGDLEPEETPSVQSDVRESIRIQTIIAEIGAKMKMQIWIPRGDRSRVKAELQTSLQLLENLPLNYNEAALKTIENIDVIWLKGGVIMRAFEVEHTTSIYSGLLRMADLCALLPNINIKLHIVAPSERRNKVLQEIRRPVFALLEPNPLHEVCTYLSYESIAEIASIRHLRHTSDGILNEYAEVAE